MESNESSVVEVREPGAAELADRLRQAMLSGQRDEIAATLADDVEFYSPAFADPAVGRETVAAVLTAAAAVYGPMDFGELLAAGSSAALFFDAEVSGHRLQVCYRLQASADGRVARLDALMRPVEATQALVEQMMRRLGR